ncbi:MULTISPECIES: ABC transporter permease subunit [Yersinia pseudotuberculosis complex]|uniref:Phosphate ABC transporter, permease protein PstC n=1 Tax=Yersinia pseudotuberculosis serotype O:1b (strain IP 31758) TaxID=349747 RepID=A0A0U1R0W9_YERP3|nr:MULTISPECIES: ABC transporter permease subunit [Yersinia pseudotuberculosis complex]ABS48794.1 phosphate ABC transporter, permease protein PstC [Yersinia pseudotuberculosis IP 31758]AJK15974.1 binding--dependent transport system inner membrane component family protein [Yersinia pseudotuberculosis str. PA3606]UFA60880.1 Phosphate ABC transporter permease protein PstC [Yersinia pseudotuberculosis]WLF05026.1 ABC transporter permease subunit [Yersinia pseudotuberculosis]CNF96591.1 phosphate tra
MRQTSIASPSGRDKRRAFIDRWVRMTVTSGGLLVLLTLMLIFVYLLYAVLPLFKPVSIRLDNQFVVKRNAPALALGMDIQGKIAYRIDNQGKGVFVRLGGQGSAPAGSVINEQALSAPPVSWSRAIGGQPLYGAGLSNGRFTLLQPDFSATPPGWQFPLGDQPRALDIQGKRLLHLALAEPQPQQFSVAAITDDSRLLVGQFTPQGQQITTLGAVPATVDQLLLAPDGRLLYVLSGNQVHIYQLVNRPLESEKLASDAPGSGWQLREVVSLVGEKEALSGPLTLSLLAGGKSLLVQSPDGVVTQWFDVRKGPSPQFHLTRIRSFTPASQGVLTAENTRRVFALLSPHGELSLFSSIQSPPLLHSTLVEGISHADFSPWGDSLLVENASGWSVYRLDNRYPDITWRGLWQPLWYENYPEPAYVWQSSSAEESYQAKFSLIPIIFGTLKAAVYAMLFAVPLALAGAIYTAYFMSAGLRRVVKPTIEMMGAFPTVVIGLIAGIWLAPVIERYLAGILLLPLLLALAILLCGWGSARLSAKTQWPLPAGWDVMVLLPVILLTGWLALWLGPSLAVWALGQPLHEWLGDDYDQRNALVVGVAMGFALIPIIFSLAEDALFSVPPSLSQGSLALGATPWQTLLHVVLPSAYAGIFSAVMIGFGRAVGETMIVLMATGNSPIIDGSIFQGLRAMAANIAIEMPEAVVGSGHYRVLFLTALVLFCFTFLVNTLAEAVRLRLRERYQMERTA